MLHTLLLARILQSCTVASQVLARWHLKIHICLDVHACVSLRLNYLGCNRALLEGH
jgi:hypothetical protein